MNDITSKLKKQALWSGGESWEAENRQSRPWSGYLEYPESV